jgi:hypothetical protein
MGWIETRTLYWIRKLEIKVWRVNFKDEIIEWEVTYINGRVEDIK